MKKILWIVLLLSGCSNLYAQTCELEIQNYTPYSYTVTVFAFSPAMVYPSSPTCNEIEGVIVVPAYTTYSWYNPYDFESGYIAAVNGTWGYLPNSFTSVCGAYACAFGTGFWPGYYPSDWVWEYAIIDNGGCSIDGMIGNACAGWSTAYNIGTGWCGDPYNVAEWQSLSGGDITITIDW